MQYVLLIVGFILLIKGADFFVEGSASVAKLLKIPSLIIGLTIVAFGTSMPEASVSISAAINGNNGIAVGNVIGSNIFNLLAIVGICGLVNVLDVDKDILRRDYTYSVIITIVLGLMLFIGRDVNRLEGIILLLLFAFFLFYTIKSALANRTVVEGEDYKILPAWLSVIYIVGGLIAIMLGGNMVVKGATKLATQFGLSDTLIGLTIVAVGTSLPELVTSLVATGKGENGIAIGNVVGSNIFNMIFILGMSASIKPISVDIFSIYDILFLLVVTIIVWYLAGNDGKIKKFEGAFMVFLYIAYTVYIILR